MSIETDILTLLPGSAIGIFAVAAVVLLLWILSRPIKLALKLLANAAAGFVLLFVTNYIGQYTGFSIGTSWLTCIIAGTFGVPGVLLLLLYTLFGTGGLF